VFFQKETGTRFALVPYRSAPAEVQDLMAGRIDISFNSMGHLPLARAGGIRAFTLTSDVRSALAPEVPTFAELGLPTLSYSAWGALFAPGGTPNEFIGKQCRGRRGIGRSGGAISSHRPRVGDFPARTADPGSSWRDAEGRHREMVADHQGVRDGAGMNRFCCVKSLLRLADRVRE
jgi:hypothetical protein